MIGETYLKLVCEQRKLSRWCHVREAVQDLGRVGQEKSLELITTQTHYNPRLTNVLLQMQHERLSMTRHATTYQLQEFKRGWGTEIPAQLIEDDELHSVDFSHRAAALTFTH